jgi:hypothetical protein
MSGYLEHLVTRVVAPGAGLRPRQASIFEPAAPEALPAPLDERETSEYPFAPGKAAAPSRTREGLTSVRSPHQPAPAIRAETDAPHADTGQVEDAAHPPDSLDPERAVTDTPAVLILPVPAVMRAASLMTVPTKHRRTRGLADDVRQVTAEWPETQRDDRLTVDRAAAEPVGHPSFPSSPSPATPRSTVGITEPDRWDTAQVPIAVAPVRLPMIPMPVADPASRMERNRSIVQVTIGRVDVRARTTAAPPRQPSSSTGAAPTLEEYLDRRRGGSR